MGDRDPGRRRRLVVPFEVAPLLRAPYGWTNRMRRAEGHPARGERHPVPLGRWATLAWTLALYGPVAAGALIGWQLQGGWLGAGVGALVALTIGLVVALAAIPVVALLRRDRP